MRASLCPILLTFASAALAAPVNLGTLAVAGGGTFGCDQQDFTNSYTIGFTGSNANFSVRVNSSGLPSFPCFGSFAGESVSITDTPSNLSQNGPITGTVTPLAPGGFSLFTDAVTFQLGNGTGFIDLYDNASAQPGNPPNLLATATLAAFVNVTSAASTGPPDVTASGTFTITPAADAPEPNSALLLLMAALWPAAAAAAYSVHRRTRTRSDTPASESSPSSQS
ncbi:MAG TPA: hypothetical protein VKB88_15950 [Bryobacteraceae bacterium]|nr:hypothetical protein [Bryobacteraceae bacterium]